MIFQTNKGNIERFPDDFMFQLTKEEWNVLRSQIATAKTPEDEAIALLAMLAKDGVVDAVIEMASSYYVAKNLAVRANCAIFAAWNRRNILQRPT
jgi:hypothetical protein